MCIVFIVLLCSTSFFFFFFFFNDTATTEIYTLSLHDALPISRQEATGVSGCPTNFSLSPRHRCVSQCSRQTEVCRTFPRRNEMTRRNSLLIAVCVLLTAGAIFAADDKSAEDYMTTSDGVKIHYY